MDLLKALWPTAYKIREKDVRSFIVQLVIFGVFCIVVGFLIGLLAKIVIIGIVFSLVGALFELYSLVGIALCILNFLGVIK